MKMSLKEKIDQKLDRNEILRYLQAKNEVSKEWQAEIESVIEEVYTFMSPTYAAVADNIEVRDAHLSLSHFELDIESKNLSNHLKASDKIWIVVATLGHAIERKIQYHFTMSPTRAIIMDACGSAIIEAYCDIIEEEISEESGTPFFTSRFSPGYGDLDLSYQSVFFDKFQFSKKTGIHLSKGDLMVPQKSVLFILGNLEQYDETKGCGHKCLTCQLKTCIYRTED